MRKRLTLAIFAALALMGALAVPASADVEACYSVSVSINGEGTGAADCQSVDTP
jgi:hypothetical protein